MGGNRDRLQNMPKDQRGCNRMMPDAVALSLQLCEVRVLALNGNIILPQRDPKRFQCLASEDTLLPVEMISYLLL